MDDNGPSNAEVYAKYADDLVRFATSLVGPTDAQDVVADAVVRVMWSKRWARVTNYKAYLYRAVLNEARMHHRSTMRRRVAIGMASISCSPASSRATLSSLNTRLPPGRPRRGQAPPVPRRPWWSSTARFGRRST